jgi:hypothetical protein
MLEFVRGLVWRLYQMLLAFSALGINASLEYPGNWAAALPLAFATAWGGTIFTIWIID